MQTQKKLLAENVLDYWFTLEFLSQDKYPDSRDIRGKVEKHKKNVERRTAKNRAIEDFIFLKTGDHLYQRISEEAIACGMKKWGNLTIYIGKMKRERCIECISQILPFHQENENRPEKSTDQIAWMSLQLTPEGNYIEHSLSVSTIIWAINQLKAAKDKISDALDNKLYKEATEELEKRFFKTDKKDKDKKLTEVLLEERIGEIEPLQTISANAVSVAELRNLYQEVENKYIKGNIENSEKKTDAYEEIYGVSFQLFVDEETKNKREDDNYLGLDHDYYSDDIKFILEQVRSGALRNDEHMGKEILEYVTILSNDTVFKNKRINLVEQKQQGTYLKLLHEILAIQNAPLGKWPSRFMPALMQQIAVNLAIGKGDSELYGMNGKVFSVNGPPGTGKTTLLKEIVVSNIIERAILLADYDKPDDAFEAHNFLHGDGPEAAYSQYIRHWYDLKNKVINDYSMLVTSCNNAAVENISKELPRNMIGDLSPLDGDTGELRDLLLEVMRLFDAHASDTIETNYKGETYRDVYFTKYAEELLDSSDVWGLVAAPLGKKSNLRNFYHKVLYPLERDFYNNNRKMDERADLYAKAKKAFMEQLKIVREMQAALGKAGVLFKEKSRVEEEILEIRKQCELGISESRNKLTKCQMRLSALKALEKERFLKLRSCEASLHQKDQALKEKQNQLASENDKLKKALQNEFAVRSSVGILTQIFNKSKYQAAMSLADEHEKDADLHRVYVSQLEAEIINEKEALKHAEILYRQNEQEYNKCKNTWIDFNKTIEREEKNIKIYQERIEQQILKWEVVRKAYESEMAKFADSDFVDSHVVLDENFIEQLLSDDVEESTAAQVANPWFTQRYNREREKLFAFALRLNKEFVVSSKYCRNNLKTLAQYWGLKAGDENERIIFHEEDRENMVPALFQTLFLLVPVISSTFASIGNLLKDVKQSGAIGMLIVDEAGQAQPQMAVGALYRSRRAVIVGDPKQVEPVVTDDLILLKKAYCDDDLKPYGKKSLSVQGFADQMNVFGTYFDNGSDYPEWVGCPLLVHRRCISPMYDISNEISYSGMMKQQTKLPKKDKALKFIYDKSQWINVKGNERGDKNHFVEEQGEKVCELLEVAFSKNPEPSIYIISPFSTVVSAIKEYIKGYCRKNRKATKIDCDYMLDYNQKKIGTVHTFQGKEADEVIFLLGCDTSEGARGAIRWVNRNIVNVAVTRAKYRLYVIGDEEAWRTSDCIRMTKEIIDTFAIKKIKSILETDLPENERQEELAKASSGLPSITSFATPEIADEGGSVDYSVDTSGLIRGLSKEFLKMNLTPQQLDKFGFKDTKDLEELSTPIKENLLLGMKLYFLLEPVYKINRQLDASCCAILFCKAMELRMKECFIKSLKEIFPDFKIRGMGKGRTMISLKNANNEEFTLGTFDIILKNKGEELAGKMTGMGKSRYDKEWWGLFERKLKNCKDRRNQCCHSGLFTWREQSFFLFDMFTDDAQKQGKIPKVGGILFESRVGKELEVFVCS